MTRLLRCVAARFNFGACAYVIACLAMRCGIPVTSGQQPQITRADVHRDRRQGCLIAIASVVVAAVWTALVWIGIAVWRW